MLKRKLIDNVFDSKTILTISNTQSAIIDLTDQNLINIACYFFLNNLVVYYLYIINLIKFNNHFSYT